MSAFSEISAFGSGFPFVIVMLMRVALRDGRSVAATSSAGCYCSRGLGNAMMRETESNADSDADAETRSAPGDLGAPPRSRATKW